MEPAKMKTPPPPPPKTAPAPPPTTVSKALPIRRTADVKPRYRVVLNAVAGWGKTTVMAYAPNPVILTAPMESGIDTLRVHGRVPDVPSLPVRNFTELLGYVRNPALHEYDTLCVDALGGMVSMLAANVRDTDFEGSEAKFSSWGRGPAVVAQRFASLLLALDEFPGSVIVASHSEVNNFSNPSGDNYSRYESDSHKDVWSAITRWADAVLFGTFYVMTKDGKAKGGKDRVVYTEHDAAHDAKNRHGLPSMIPVPSDPAQAYNAIFSLIK